MAPTVLRDGQFRLFFFSREEARIHVHVSHPDGEAKFWLTPHIHLAISAGLDQRQIREAQSIVETHIGAITNAWHSHFDTRSTHVSKHGCWLLLADEELLLSFDQFPWFRRANIEQICHVEWPAPENIYWPELDIDLSLASIRRPEEFPLVSRSSN